MAVLPFSVSGEGVNYLAEGLVDLMSINLETVGVIHTADSRIVLRLHREAGRPRDPDVPAALALARGLGVGSVLMGSVTASGTDLELSATLRRTDGWQIAGARAEGPAADVLALVDDLSSTLIEDIWRSREPAPGFDVSAVTTGSSQALNHYLRGEALYRRGQWRAAANAFTRAVRADTTFALAYARLSDTYGWADGIFTERADLNLEAAHRFADRLPDRKRRFVVARWQAGQEPSDRIPADSLRELLDSYPDDLEVLHLLAEIGFHQRPLYAMGLEELMEPVERLLALDSTMTAGLIHPIEVALQFGDQARFERYLGMAEATGLRRAPDFRRVGTALWDAPDTRDVVARELMANVGSAFTYTVGSYRVGVGSPVDFRSGLDAVIPLVPAERKAALWRIRTLLLTTTGRVAEAGDTARLDVVPDPVIRAHLTDYPAVAGFIDPEEVTDGLAIRVTGDTAEDSIPRWETRFLQALAYLASGDAGRGEAALDLLQLDDPPAASGSVASGLVDASRGWVLLLKGDTAAAIERLQAGLTQAGRWTSAGVNTAPNDAFGAMGGGAALSFRLVAAMASWRPTADQGLRLLHDLLWSDFHYEVLRHYELGHALERVGQRVEARESYDRFLRLLEGADDGLLIADEMDRAREGLIRLAG
jgi:tetratricopeptide (TPR) repeat protein